jgi:imidazolonepropionase-like amidohydrolase
VTPLAPPPIPKGGLVAYRVGRAETISNGTIEHAVILVDGAKIALVGEDLVVERGIEIVDRPDWVAMPGLVNAYSRLGMDGRGGSSSTPHLTPERELYPHHTVYDDVLETGITTLGLYPAGTGIPGQAIVVRPEGDQREDMVIADTSYLKIYFRSNARSKKLIKDGFEKVDKYDEDEKKAREKYDKEAEKAKKKKKSSKSKKDDEKEEEKKEEEEEETKELGPYVPPTPDPEVVPFQKLRAGELAALVSIGSAGDYLHLLDAIDEEEFEWSLRVPVSRELNLYEIADELGEDEVRLVMEPAISLHPGTMRQRNLPAELTSAGAKLVFIPRNDNTRDYKSWLAHVGEIVAAGLDRDVALRAMTLEPAELLGLGDRLGSLEAGKDANIVFLSGDPLETGTKVEAVLLEGRVVHGEVD